MDYTKVILYTSSEGVESAISILYDLGITGVEIMDKNDFEEFMKSNLRAWDVVDEELMNAMLSKETTITFYLENDKEKDKTLDEIKKALSILPQGEKYGRMKIETSLIKNEDWENNWKKYYKPLRIGKHIVIKPTWEQAEIQEGDALVELDPGMAFGTGSHASTHMCLEFLENSVKKGDRVLDIGTGSGILGIAALKLGASSVTAVDIDPMAVKIARDNAEKNGYTEPEFNVMEGDLDDKAKGQYDIVTANIVADIICELTKTVGKYIKDGGIFITSGIIDFKAKKVKEALKSAGITIKEEKAEKDWRAFLCERT